MSDALLQFEIDRARWRTADNVSFMKRSDVLDELVLSVARDVIRRGGTMVLVSSPSTITVVQRDSAETLSTKPDAAPVEEGQT